MSTTTNFYVGAGDGDVNATSTVFATVHDATTGTAAATSTTGYSLCDLNGSNYRIYRAFFPVDTSAIPDTATISASSLYVANTSARTDVANQGIYNVVESSQASTSTLENNDYDNVGSTKFSGDVVDSGDAGAYVQFAFNATGIAAVSKTGYTKVAVRAKKDVENTAPANVTGADTNFALDYSEKSGTSTDPYLSVTYDLSTGTSPLWFMM